MSRGRQKSRSRAKTSKATPRQAQRPPATQKRWGLRSLFQVLVATPIRRIELGVSLLAGFLAILDATRPPSIAPELPVTSTAFASPFTVENNSLLFTMQQTQLNCENKETVLTVGARIINGTMIDTSLADIGPGGMAQYHCQVYRMSGAKVRSTQIVLYVKYKTIGIPRESNRLDCAWTEEARPQRWVCGKLVD